MQQKKNTHLLLSLQNRLNRNSGTQKPHAKTENKSCCNRVFHWHMFSYRFFFRPAKNLDAAQHSLHRRVVRMQTGSCRSQMSNVQLIVDLIWCL